MKEFKSFLKLLAVMKEINVITQQGLIHMGVDASMIVNIATQNLCLTLENCGIHKSPLLLA